MLKSTKIISVWILKAIVNEEEISRTYALEFSHLPHASFKNADWSDSTTEETACLDYDYDSPQVIEAIKNSKKYLLEQIERNNHLLIADLSHELLTDILWLNSKDAEFRGEA